MYRGISVTRGHPAIDHAVPISIHDGGVVIPWRWGLEIGVEERIGKAKVKPQAKRLSSRGYRNGHVTPRHSKEKNLWLLILTSGVIIGREIEDNIS